MKTIGLLGGMSWESTQTYYRLLNQQIRHRLGGLHSARVILYSVDFADIADLQKSNEWERAGEILAQAARSLEDAGAECLLIGTNTMHKVAPQVSSAISIPLLHIMDSVAEAALADGVKTVALLGTQFTMEQPFCIERLEAKGLNVLVPGHRQRQRIHQVIFEELCVGEIRDSSRTEFLSFMDELKGQGAEGVILGCTEIGLLVTPADTDMTLYDTTELHVASAVDFALEDSDTGSRE